MLIIGFWYLIKIGTTPLPGEEVADQGRDHVASGTKVAYHSNPPTSGAHYEEWEKAGIYKAVLLDEKLVHSLEHGFIIISYNCDYQIQAKIPFSLRGKVYAHNEENNATPSAHLDVVEWQNNKDCQDLTTKLENLASGQKLWKLIVVPRPNLDGRIALTAWRRIDKFNQFDEQRIVRFIKAFRNNGPEQTMD